MAFLSGPEFYERSQKFLDWFKGIPEATFHEYLSLDDLRSRDAGRGITAKSHIPAYTELFKIPRTALITVANSKLSKEAPQLFNGGGNSSVDEDDQAAGSNSWISLILTMIYEHLQGPRSHWKPYFDVLPENFDTLMFWTEEELEQLQASTIRQKIGKADAEDMFRKRILPAIKDHPDVFYPEGVQPLSEPEIIALAHRMGSLIMSYSFELEKDEDEDEENADVGEDTAQDGWIEDTDSTTLAMLPMADIMNSDAEFNAHVDHSGEIITVTSLRDIHQHEEVLNYYGPLPNSDLLRRYGYVSEKHSRYDVVEIPKSLLATAIQRQLNVPDAFRDKALSYLDDDLDEPVVIERDGGEPNSDGTLSAPVQNERMLSELEEATTAMLKCFKKVSVAVLPNKRRQEELCHIIIPLVLTARMAEYGTSFAEDQVLLSRPETTGRLRMAVQLRLGEKLLLQEALYRASLVSPVEKFTQDANGQRLSKKARVA